MPTVYHGTRHADAVAMAGIPANLGTINVTIGRGEFGRGFYTQTGKASALTRAQNHYPAAQRPCILQLAITDQPFNALNRRTLNHGQASQLTRRLRANGTTGTYVAGRDVIIGPLNGSRHIVQQKFESQNAQNLLNGPQTQRTVI
jgi:hypothetical protein